MLEVLNAQSDAPSIEQLAVVGDCLTDIYFADLDAAEKLIYSAGAIILAPTSVCNVINIPNNFQISRITSTPLNQGVDTITTTELDYLTLSATDKTDLDAFIVLIIAKCW